MRQLLQGFALALMVATAAVGVEAQSAESDVLAFFKAYDAAFNAKDMDKLATMYHTDVTIFEGAGVNRGWVDYRDNHLGPEMKSFQNLQWAHSNIVVHKLSESAAYVTADYTIKYQAGERAVDSGGIATHVLVKDQGRWKIRHSMTAARRRAPGGAGISND
ncbi:MAG TPA: nuclear transport factor 2 family protein [Vicinamibacterales bacterium]|nr:nuclear transport factor 2 family protein [Vicinamibacterales bacterium]